MAIAGFWIFITHLLTGKMPLFRPQMLADRNLMTGTLFLFILGLVMMASMALLSPMLQNLYGYPVLETGMLLAARGLGVMVAMAASGRMMEKIDPRLMVFAGFVMMALSLWYMTGWSLEMDWHPVVWTGLLPEIGSASCRERVCQYVLVSGVA